MNDDATACRCHLNAFAATWAATFSTPEARSAFDEAKRAGASTVVAFAAARGAFAITSAVRRAAASRRGA